MNTLKKTRTIVGIGLLTCFCFFNVLFAQNTTQHFLNYTEFEGLPDNHVNCFTKDQQGYLWIGTANGLSRFDGKTFENFYFDPNDSNTISGNSIDALYCDSKNNLWIAVTGNGITKLNLQTDKFSRFYHNETDSTSLGANAVKDFNEDLNGTIWIATFGFGLDCYDEKNNSFKHHLFYKGTKTNYTPNEVATIKRTSNGNFWLTTRNGIVFFNPLSKHYKVHYIAVKDGQPFLGSNVFFNSYIESDSCIWFSSGYLGLLKYNPISNVFTMAEVNKIYEKNIVFSITPKNENELLVITSDNGLGVYSKIKRSITFFKKQSENRFSIIDTLNATSLFNSGENVFIGFNNGLSILSPASDILSYTKLEKPGLNITLISDIFYYKPSRKFYFGCAYSYGIFAFDSVSGITNNILLPFFESKLPVYQFKEITSGSSQYLAATSKGLYIFDAAKEVFYESEFIKKVNSFIGYKFINAFTSGVNHTIWVGGKQFILELDFTKNSFSSYSKLININSNDSAFVVNSLYSDSHQNIWATTYASQIFIKEKNNTLFHRLLSNNKPVVSPARIDCILEDAQGNYWLGTFGSGLLKISEGDFSMSYVSAKNTNSGNAVFGMTLDSKGKLWVATNTGIFQWDTQKNTSIHFSEKNGFLKNCETSLFQNDLGIVLIANNNFCVINPEKIWKDLLKPIVSISSFNIFGASYPSDSSIAFLKQITLNHSQNNFSINFIAPDFNNSDGIRFDFILENFDKTWHLHDAANQATYTNVPPGNYIFRIKACNSSKKYSDEKLLYITIIPAYWQTWWFKVLLVLLITGAVYALYLNRINQIKKQEAIKSDYEKKVVELETIALRAQMNPHFIFNCLNSINRYILMSDPDTASSYVTKFSRLIRLILDNSRSNEVTLEQELSATCLYMEMEAMRFKNKFNYTITVQEGLYTQKVLVPPMILQPFAENAIWHGLMHKSESGTLAIYIGASDQQLHCVFDDDGVGRKKSALLEDTSIDKKKSHGMLVTGKRLAIFNDAAQGKNSINIIDKTDANGIGIGTRVEVTLALKTIS